MPDEADRSDKAILDRIAEGIDRAAREAAKPKVHYTECNWCGDDTEDGARYCCKDCATDHMRYNAARRRNGEGND